MIFDTRKKDILSKKDKSSIGSIDKKIRKLVDLINTFENFYTTSSCSGRIVLINIVSKRKDESRWIYVSHDKAKYKDIKGKLIPSKGKIYFRCQPMILHIACRSIEDAHLILEKIRSVYKRAGIISIKKTQVVIEIIGTEVIDTIISKDEKIMIDDDYLKFLVSEANKKLELNHKNIEKLYEKLKKEIK